MLGKFVGVVSIMAAAALAAVFHMTTPMTIGPLGILIVFILLYVSVLGALTFLLYGFSRALVKAFGVISLLRFLNQLSFRQAYYYSSVLALAPILLIGLQSVNEVKPYQVLLVAAFIAIATIVIKKRSS